MVRQERPDGGFFAREGVEVAPDLADSWYVYQGPRVSGIPFEGRGRILLADTIDGARQCFRIAQAVIYTKEWTEGHYTKAARELANSEPGTLRVYGRRGAILPFVSLEDAENIRLAQLQMIDRTGADLDGDDTLLNSTQFCKLVGLAHQSVARLDPYTLREETAFWLRVTAELSSQELVDLERELFPEI